jgi:hypothetical protein
LLGKAGKAISKANTHVAELRASNQRLLHQLDQAQIKLPRKRIRPDPNQRFSDQDTIRAAISQAAVEAARKTTKRRDRKAIKAVTQSVTTTFDSMCIDWQI